MVHGCELVDASTALSTTLTHFSSVISEETIVEKAAEFDALGSDILIFLAASVLVVPTSRALGISPVLGFLAVGCAIGPYGLSLFGNTEADLELGDFGILFLLFVEGLNLSPDKLKDLGAFFKLGFSQLAVSISLFFFGTLLLGPTILPTVETLGIPLDDAILRPIVNSPVESFCIAAAGALSSSAFVLPVLKQKGWEASPDGIAALSILLLQDLAVAPLLVLLPLVAGSGPQGASALGFLAFKATFGFGAVLAAGSYVLKEIFTLVASARSTETFVAATLLVAVGMGQLAEALGLSATTGAFAAGVLLAGNPYRAQIQADIKPFEGILLGVFFMTAGAELDPQLTLREWPTLLTGILAFIATKAAVLFAAGPSLGLQRAEAAKVALLLAGGGEFALVIFKLAEDLGVLPDDLGKLLIASVIISMSLTPLLGELAEAIAGRLAEPDEQEALGIGSSADASAGEYFYDGAREVPRAVDAQIQVSGGQSMVGQTDDGDFWDNAIVVCGFGSVGQALSEELAANNMSAAMDGANSRAGGRATEDINVVSAPMPFVAFDLNPARMSAGPLGSSARVVYGDGASAEVLRAAGVRYPHAVVITYEGQARRLDAVTRLRAAFPKVPIFTRASSAPEADELHSAGATGVVPEAKAIAARLRELSGIEAMGQDMEPSLFGKMD